MRQSMLQSIRQSIPQLSCCAPVRSGACERCTRLEVFDHEVHAVGDRQEHREREQVEHHPGEYEEHQRAE